MKRLVSHCGFPTSMRGVLLLLVLVVLLPSLVVQIGIYAAWFHTRWNEQEAATLDTAREAAATFHAYIRDVHRQELAIGATLAGPHMYTPDQANAFLATAGQGYASVRSWMWADVKGRVIASNQPKAIGLDVSDQAYFVELRGGRSWVVSGLMADQVDGARAFVVASRISNQKGGLAGAVIATIDVKDLGDRAVALHHAVGEAVALFDYSGVLVYNSQEQRNLYQDWRERESLLNEAIRSDAEQSGLMRLTIDGEAKEKVIAARVPVSEIGWVAGARRPVAIAMADVYTGLWVAAGLNLLVAIASGGLAWKTGGSLIGQLRRLQLHAQAIGQGDYGHTAEGGKVRELAELDRYRAHLEDLVQQRTSELEGANTQLQAVFDVVNVGMLLIDRHGTVRRVNNTLSRWVGRDLSTHGAEQPGDLIGCINALADSAGCGTSEHCGACAVRKAIASVLESGRPVHDIETAMTLSIDGKEACLWLEASIDPLMLNGKPHVIMALSNVTARKQAEEVLQRTAEQLARSNEELEQFAYVASHDLQEPLRVVTGYVQLLDRKYKSQLDADADQFLHYIVDGVARMQQLINDLLNYSRVGTRGASFHAIRVQRALDRALANLKTVIEETDAVVTHAPLPEVHGDETQLTQLLQNLISNGVKFRSERPPQIHISAQCKGSHWELAVRDNGIGIEQQYWKQIFVIFQRLHTRHKYSGTGIGLAICKRIVERHGGRIWLDSTPGEGTTFYFTLS